MSHTDDFPTLVSSLQASTVEWSAVNPSFRLSGSGVFSGANLRNKYLRFMQVLQQVEELFSVYRLSPSAVLIAWCASLQDSGVAPHFVGLLVDLILQGNLPHLALGRCLRLIDVFLDWTTRPNAGNTPPAGTSGGTVSAGPSCPVLIPSYAVARWAEQTWNAVVNLSRDNAGTSTPTATAALCGGLQLLPVLLRWNAGPTPLPPLRRGYLPHPVNMQSEEARLLAYRVLPAIVRYQPNNVAPQSYAGEIIEYVRRGCVKSSDIFVRIAAAASVRGVLEAGLRVSSPAVAFALMEMLLGLCDDVSPFDIADEVLHDVGVAMGYLLAFYQSDFTVDALHDVLLAAAPLSKAAADERGDGHRRGVGGGGAGGGAATANTTGGGNASASASGAGGGGGGAGAAASGSGGGSGSGAGRLRWKYFGGSDAVEGSRVVQRCFNERMTRTAQRALATALATLCSTCATPATTASVIQCCFVLLMPIEEDARQYMPRLLADAIQEWAQQLPSNGYRVVLADVLRGYVQRPSEDRAVVRTAMVALQGVVRTLSSSLEIGFNVADDVLAAVNATPSLLHTGVEVLGAVARTNTLYARQLQHECARVGSAEVANTLSFQLHIRALLDASSNMMDTAQRSGASSADDALAEEDRVSLVHVCIRLLLRLSRGDPPRAVRDIHYRQAELIFRLTQLLYDLLHGSPPAVLKAVREELQPCTLGFMNLLVSSPAPTIAFYKAVTAACAMLRRAPIVSDTERMLAVGFLEARLTSQDGVARRNVDAAGSSAATAYFAVSKGALYQLVARHPWPTCKDDGSLRWLAAQALKDMARACARSAPIYFFAELHGPAMAAAAQSMKVVRSSLLHPRAASTTVSAAAETPAHPLEECGGHALRLLRWTLRHFIARGAVAVCVALLASLHSDLYKVYAVPVSDAATMEERTQQTLRREMALWNTLCAVHELLHEATPTSATAALWASAKWKAEVTRWHTIAAQLVPATAQEAVEVRLLAAKVVAISLVSTGQVDVFTSQTVTAVAQGSPTKTTGPLDPLGALMILCEAHAQSGEMSGSSGAVVASSPTLPLATSLLADAWKRMGLSAFAAPVLTLLSLRLAQVHAADVEVALADSVVGVLLAPMTAANAQWWSGTTALGILTAIVQLWTAFPGDNDAVAAVPQSAALLLVQESLAAATQTYQTAATAITAALDAAEAFTRHQGGSEERSMAWRMLMHLCVEHTTHIQHEDECLPSPLVQHKGRASLRRFVVLHDGVSGRLARLWCAVLLGSGSAPLVAAAVADAGGTRQLSVVDVAIQIDLATVAVVRREWVRVAQAMSSALLPGTRRAIAGSSGTPTPAPTDYPTTTASSTNGSGGSSSLLTPAFAALLAAVHAILQSRSPDVDVDLAKRDADMFAAVDEAGGDGAAGDGVRGGGGGSDSDNSEDYREEFEEGGMGGILAEAGNGGRDGGTASTSANTPALTAASLTFDVAAKEAVMWVLYGVLKAVGASVAALADPAGSQADEARRAVLPMVVAAAQLVEVHPEVQLATIAVLHEVLASWGAVAQQRDSARPAAVLLPWKTQLVVSLTTVLQHGLLSLEACTALAVQYSRCNLADSSSCRRVLRSLLLLLHACHRLQDRQRAFLLGGSSGAGHIIVAIAKVAQAPAMAAETLEAAQETLVRTLASSPCQAALTLLCERFVTAVSLANGYVQSTSAFGGWGGDDEDGSGASAESSVYGSRMSVTAADVLQAVAFLSEEPLRAPLGPALRYAAGCLVCLVLAALPAPSHERSSSGGGGAAAVAAQAATLAVQHGALRQVVALSGRLTTQHQRILAQLAQQRLLTFMRSWEQAHPHHTRKEEEDQRNNEEDKKEKKNGHIGEAVQRDELTTPTWNEVTALLRVAAVAPMPRLQAEELLRAFTPHVVVVGMAQTDTNHQRWTEVVASLLCVGLTAKLELSHHLLPLLTALPADAFVGELLPPSVTARVQHAACAYLQSCSDATARAVALAGPAGLLLVCRSATLAPSPAMRSPFLDTHLWPAVLQLFGSAASPVKTLEYICSPVASGADGADVVPLRACVVDHSAEVAALLAVFASLPASSSDAPSTPSLDVSAMLLLRCGPLLSELLIGKLTVAGDSALTADAVHAVLSYVVTVLSSKLSPAYAVALNAVGRYLVRTVAPAHGAALRGAIQRLGAAKAGQLRVFMEESCN